MKYLLLVLVLFSGVSAAQERKEKTVLDFMNSPGHPFTTENDITGKCFITLSENFDCYKKPIIIKEKNGSEILKIIVTNLVTTTYKTKTYNQTDTTNPFKPWLFSASSDYFRLAFECIDTTGSFFKIKLSDTEFATIEKKNPDFQKTSISDFVSSWTSLGLDFDRSVNPVRESPGETAKTIVHGTLQKYKIWRAEGLEIKGDWIKVKTFYDEVGWIRWKNGKKVLIRMYFSC